MLMFVERRIFRTSSNLLRRFSVSFESTLAPHHMLNGEEDFIDNNKDFTQLRSDDNKSLRVAIIGLPNVGKSTLINQLIERPVSKEEMRDIANVCKKEKICPTAARIHLTKVKANAVYSRENTQLVFVDTPGLVTNHEFKKFKMSDSFRTDSKDAISSAEIVGVVQDASNKYTRGTIHDKILELLKMTGTGVTSILILNKIDAIKRKRDLLGLVHWLTSENAWPNFSDVFMVSALTSDGINDLRNYLLDSAKPRDWDYASNVITDQAPERIVERTILAKLMDCMPNEIPYQLQVIIEHFSVCEDGSIHAIAIINTKSDRISKLVMGKGGSRIKNIALESEQQLSSAFRTAVRLKVAIKFHTEKEIV